MMKEDDRFEVENFLRLVKDGRARFHELAATESPEELADKLLKLNAEDLRRIVFAQVLAASIVDV